MSVTISATATGSETLQQPEGDDKTQNIINGDFLITPDRYYIDCGALQKASPTGDGIDEETCWTFYFDEPGGDYSLLSNEQPLSSALLTLTLTPATNAIGGLNTDVFWIEPLPIIFLADALAKVFPSLSFDRVPEIDTNPNHPTNLNIDSVLPLNQAKKISFDLLDHYTSEDILRILFNNAGTSVGGRILMHYNDDAIVSVAKLELTQ